MEVRIICDGCGCEYRVADRRLNRNRMRFTCKKCQRAIELAPASTGLQISGGKLKSPFGGDIPSRFGKFRNLERLASGGMGDVFKAVMEGAEGFERTVVLKVLHPHLSRDETFSKVLIDEAKITVMMHHPNIVQMYDLEKHEDLLYCVMEYVPGKSLSHVQRVYRRKGARIPLKMALYVVMHALEGLAYAHELKGADGKPLGIVHRDISPQNILITNDGWVKIIDFGIAKAASRITETMPGIIKGKFAYMAPEQLKGITDHRADIFAMGVVLWETLAGVRLFYANTDVDTLHKVMHLQAPPISLSRREIPDKLDKILERALEKDLDKRFQSAREFKKALAEFIAPASVDDLRSEVNIEAEQVEAVQPAGDIPFRDQTPIVESASLKSVPPTGKKGIRWPRYVLAALPLVIIAAALWFVLGGKKIDEKPAIAPDAGLASAVDAAVAAAVDAGWPQQEPVDAGQPPAEPAQPAAGGPDGGVEKTDGIVQAKAPAVLTRPVVERVLYKNASRLQACADKHLALDHLGESVSLKLRFTIGAGGRVVEAGLEPNKLEGSGFGKCLLERVRAIGFPAHRDPSVTVVFPLTFRSVQ